MSGNGKRSMTLAGAAADDWRVTRFQSGGNIFVEVGVQRLPLGIVQQYVGAFLTQKIHGLLWRPLVPLHQVAANKCRTARPASLAVNVDRVARAFKTLDELHAALELFLTGCLKDVRSAQLEELDATFLPLFLTRDPIS